jgi:hypothetical protein
MMNSLLILAVLAVVLVGAVLWKRRGKVASAPADGSLAPKPLESLLETIDATPDRPVGFGYKMCWLAVRSENTDDVVSSLLFENRQPANWQTGFVAAYNGHTFISPSVNGWVFVVSHELPELGDPPQQQEWNDIMSSLSQEHGEVQYFGTHRVSEFHAWARFANGIEDRAFAYCDGILVDRGTPSTKEKELGCSYFDENSPEAKSKAYWEREDLCYPDEEHVMKIAGDWSINPISLGESDLPVGVGWIGNLVRSESEAR